jgi:hypothetical protein
MIKSLASYLATQSTITAKVGTRVYQMETQQGSDRPYINLQQISEVTRYTHSGDAGLNTIRAQISVFGDSLKSADETSKVVHTLLSGFRGAMAGTEVQAIFREDKQNQYEENSKIHHSRQDYFITYKE